MVKYNWKKSFHAFRTFKFVFERGESTLKDIASQFNLDKSTITHHVRGFRDAELIETSYKNREKIHWINKEKLAKELRFTGSKNDLIALVMLSESFEDLKRRWFNGCKKGKIQVVRIH